MKEHAVIYTYWDNLGEGWRMECACGFCTIPAGSLQTAAEISLTIFIIMQQFKKMD